MLRRRCGVSSRSARKACATSVARLRRNPRTQIADLTRIGELCAARGLLYVVDNTMTSPYLYLPKRDHAGLIVNSLTKYIGGHGNSLGGAVTDTGFFDWTHFSNIYDNYKNAAPALWGIQQIRKKGLRDVRRINEADVASQRFEGAEQAVGVAEQERARHHVVAGAQ